MWSRRGETTAVWPGRTWPMGADWGEESTNFAVHAPDATAVWVCLFDDHRDDGDDDGSDRETRHVLTERSLHLTEPLALTAWCG